MSAFFTSRLEKKGSKWYIKSGVFCIISGRFHMSLMLVYTFCCLACSSVNDLVFKFFARKERSRGLFVCTVGVVGTLCFLFLPDKAGANLNATLLWGVICGIFSAVGNILLIESMTNLSAGVCSTIYRLNLALVVPFSVLIFNEKLVLSQYAGIVLALLAVLAFLPGNGAKKSRNAGKKALLPMAMVITAALFRAGLGLSCKYGPLQGASINGINLIIEIIWIISGLVYYFVKENKVYKFDLQVVKYGALSGVLVAGILLFMMLALSAGNASIVLSIAQMSFLLTFILSVIFLKEKVTLFKLFAMLCGAGAILLLV